MPKIPKLKKMDLIEVTWNDAWGIAAWDNPENHKVAKLEVVSVGYFVDITEDNYLLIAGDYSTDRNGNHGRLAGRPLNMITKVRKIRNA